jgi:hypothetical protein
MPNFEPLVKGLTEAFDAVKAPTTEVPIKPSIVELPQASKMPFPGPPEVKAAVSTTLNRAPETTPEKILRLKRLAEGFIRPDPGVTKPVEETLYKGRSRSRASHDIANLDVADWYSPLQRDPKSQNQLVNWYMTTADEVAQAERYGKDRIRDVHIDVWKNTLDKLQEQVDADPEVQSVLEKIRGGLDEQFNDMKARGWIKQDRYLNDYTPIRKLNAVTEAIAGYIGEDPEAMKSRILSSMQERTGHQAPRETDLPNLLRGVRAEYLQKVAEHETALDLLADPTVNLTEKYTLPDGKLMENLPSNVRVVRPGPGMFGSTLRSDEGYFLNAALRHLDPKGKVMVGGYVLNEAVADAWEHFHPRKMSGGEQKIYNMALGLMRNLTVHNPRNTNVNRVGDLMTALAFPGEDSKATAMGILRYWGKSNEAAYKGAFGKGKTQVTLHGRTVDLWDMAVREGMTSGTIAEHLAGSDIALPPELARLYETNHQNWWNETKSTLEADRLATEVAPRIAAGLDAVDRTGDWSQFGRVGRDITFRYGAGAPRASQYPIVKMLDPFIQYMGLATQRFLSMAGSEKAGPKARILLGLTAVPYAMWKWNSQNDAYKQVEDALAPEERNQLHITMPSQAHPGMPARDADGNPVVLRFRFMVPDQVMQMVGMGNTAERVERVFSGRDTPIKFAKESAQQAQKSIGDMLVLPTMLKEAVTGQSQLTGKPMTPTDWVNRVAPITRIGTHAVERGKNYGVGEGLATAGEEAAGLSFAKPKHRGPALLDADLQKAKQAQQDAKKSAHWAFRNGTPQQVRDAQKALKEASAEVVRIAEQMKTERKAGYKPPKPDKAANQPRIDANKRAVQEGS